jgi:hypothetical protein
MLQSGSKRKKKKKDILWGQCTVFGALKQVVHIVPTGLKTVSISYT